MNDARDPYLGLNNHIRQQAQEQIVPVYAIGTVLSTDPLTIRADGMNLDKDDLMLPAHLTGADWPVVSTLPATYFEGHYNQLTGTVTVYRPEERVTGKPGWTQEPPVTPPALSFLKEGDTVLLLRTEESQTYCVIERMVRL